MSLYNFEKINLDNGPAIKRFNGIIKQTFFQKVLRNSIPDKPDQPTSNTVPTNDIKGHIIAIVTKAIDRII
jgi:hypothetical protein